MRACRCCCCSSGLIAYHDPDDPAAIVAGVVFGAVHSTAPPLDIGTELFTTYLLPFEVTSVLILIAILGAIVLARKEID